MINLPPASFGYYITHLLCPLACPSLLLFTTGQQFTIFQFTFLETGHILSQMTKYLANKKLRSLQKLRLLQITHSPPGFYSQYTTQQHQ